MSRRSSNQRGAISWVGMLMLVGLVAGGYFGLMYGPSYVEMMELKQVLREAGNSRARMETDDKLREWILSKAKSIGSHWEIRDGQEMNLPGIVLLNDDVIINRDERAQTIIIQVTYTKHLNFPFFKKQKDVTFSPAIKGDYSAVNWD